VSLVSVYIPTRNRKKLLERAIQSVLNQDHKEIEVIVIDDASTDGTHDLLSAIMKSDRRVRVITHDQPRGAPTARNSAIQEARGNFVTGLDDDDYFAPTRISEFLRGWTELTTKGLKPSCLYSQSIEVRGMEQKCSRRPKTASYNDLFQHNVIGNQVFAPRQHYLDSGLFDEKLPAWQDLDMFIRILMNHGPAFLIDSPTYIYDDDDRADRISGKSDRIRSARKIISGKHPGIGREFNLALFMQMFNGFYRIEPKWEDILFVARNRPSPQHVVRMSKMIIKTRVLRGSKFRLRLQSNPIHSF
jgi:glycosyltransferase involved in cell wall biosynthesis